MPTPSKNITFAKDAYTVNVPGPPNQTDVASMPRFVTELSANHTRWVYRLTAAKLYQWSIPLAGLSGEQKADLEEFFDDAAEGPANTFTYTHTHGESFTVRFVDTSLAWTRNSDNDWDVTVRLELATEPL